ncbi:conserved hypothetical protein [Culex quinquefasciatus]|uniref:Uncharacterized protein n=1 Tax=Culex quinquefasciatus TaxID=7176 RepID=B0WSN3_CULQU|nr:conserved hypothetical protein [Culex quinquefasciatus]|eukprot:XP_001870691.1 conserved hypothetical protein [Culex quinquefasciatus]
MSNTESSIYLWQQFSALLVLVPSGPDSERDVGLFDAADVLNFTFCFWEVLEDLITDAAGVGRNERGDWRSSQANQPGPFERADAAWEVFKKTNRLKCPCLASGCPSPLSPGPAPQVVPTGNRQASPPLTPSSLQK